ARAALPGRGHLVPRWSRPAWDTAEPCSDPLEELGSPEVSDHDHDGVVRPVVGVVPGPEIARRQPQDVLREADRRQPVRMRDERDRVEELTEGADRAVLG